MQLGANGPVREQYMKGAGENSDAVLWIDFCFSAEGPWSVFNIDEICHCCREDIENCSNTVLFNSFGVLIMLLCDISGSVYSDTVYENK